MTYLFVKGLAMLGGLAVVAIGAWLNVSKVVETEGGFYSPFAFAIVAVALGSALAVVVMVNSWRDKRRGLAFFCFLAVACCECYGLKLSAERSLAVQEQRALKVDLGGSPYALAEKAYNRAIKERQDECKSGIGKLCKDARATEDLRRRELGSLQKGGNSALFASTIGLPEWLVTLIEAVLFSFGLQVLGLVLVGYGGHGSHKPEVQVVHAPPEPSQEERVVNWVRAYEQRHGRKPPIPAVQSEFGLTRSTAYRRIKSA